MSATPQEPCCWQEGWDSLTADTEALITSNAAAGFPSEAEWRGALSQAEREQEEAAWSEWVFVPEADGRDPLFDDDRVRELVGLCTYGPSTPLLKEGVLRG